MILTATMIPRPIIHCCMLASMPRMRGGATSLYSQVSDRDDTIFWNELHGRHTQYTGMVADIRPMASPAMNRPAISIAMEIAPP